MPDYQRREERQLKWEKDWEEFWKPLLLTEGRFDEEKIKNEMSDLVFIYEQISKVYCEITGNRLSKPMYYADIIINEYQEQLLNEFNFGYEEGLKDGKDL